MIDKVVYDLNYDVMDNNFDASDLPQGRTKTSSCQTLNNLRFRELKTATFAKCNLRTYIHEQSQLFPA